MAYGTTPVDTSATPIPMSSVVPDGAGTIVPLEGGPVYSGDATGNKAPASVWTKDGNDVTSGTTTDAAVTGDTAGTKSAKLRGLNKILFDLWDSTNHWLQVKVMNSNANGQSTMANSAPVTIASDDSNLHAIYTYLRSGWGNMIGVLPMAFANGCKYLVIAAATAADTLVYTGGGALLGVVVQTVGTNAVLIYDNTTPTGAVLGTLPASAAINTGMNIPAGGVRFNTGITVAGNAANPKIIVFYQNQF